MWRYHGYFRTSATVVSLRRTYGTIRLSRCAAGKKSTENESISISLPRFAFTQSTKKPAKGLYPSRVYYNLLLSETHYYIVRSVYRPNPSHPIPLALWDHFIIIQRCSETPSIKMNDLEEQSRPLVRHQGDWALMPCTSVVLHFCFFNGSAYFGLCRYYDMNNKNYLRR